MKTTRKTKKPGKIVTKNTSNKINLKKKGKKSEHGKVQTLTTMSKTATKQETPNHEQKLRRSNRCMKKNVRLGSQPPDGKNVTRKMGLKVFDKRIESKSTNLRSQIIGPENKKPTKDLNNRKKRKTTTNTIVVNEDTSITVKKQKLNSEAITLPRKSNRTHSSATFCPKTVLVTKSKQSKGDSASIQTMPTVSTAAARQARIDFKEYFEENGHFNNKKRLTIPIVLLSRAEVNKILKLKPSNRDVPNTSTHTRSGNFGTRTSKQNQGDGSIVSLRLNTKQRKVQSKMKNKVEALEKRSRTKKNAGVENEKCQSSNISNTPTSQNKEEMNTSNKEGEPKPKRTRRSLRTHLRRK